jgi:dephospho-CoA kinase
MKVFITASSGVGKSAVTEELSNRGYTAYDADDRNLKLTRLEVKESGEPANWPKGFVDWSYYSWNANEDRLEELLGSNETVIISGFLGNQGKLYHYFDKLIALSTNPKEHARRLRSRPQREVGDSEENNQRRLDKYSMHMEMFKKTGFIIIDNSGTMKETIEQIKQIIDKE